MANSVWRFVPGRGSALCMAVLAVGLVLWQPAIVSAKGPYGEGEAAAELDRFNTAMRQLYGQARSAFGAATRPVIVVGEEVTLHTADGSESRSYTPPAYHRAKAVSHLVLGLIGAVAPALEGMPEGAGWQQGLRRIAEEMDRLEPVLADLGFPPEEEALFRGMLAESRAFIRDSEAREHPDRAAFEGLMTRIKPAWLASAMTVTRAQLEGLDQVVRGWREAMPEEEWAKLHVLVTGPRNPREGNVQTAYFLRLLGERKEGGRVIYTESIFEPDQAMNLLAGMVIEREVGALVFGDPYRMDVDLLGFAAGIVLDEMLPARSAQ